MTDSFSLNLLMFRVECRCMNLRKTCLPLLCLTLCFALWIEKMSWFRIILIWTAIEFLLANPSVPETRPLVTRWTWNGLFVILCLVVGLMLSASLTFPVLVRVVNLVWTALNSRVG